MGGMTHECMTNLEEKTEVEFHRSSSTIKKNSEARYLGRSFYRDSASEMNNKNAHFIISGIKLAEVLFGSSANVTLTCHSTTRRGDNNN